MDGVSESSVSDLFGKILDGITKSAADSLISTEAVQEITKVLQNKLLNSLTKVHELLQVPLERGQRRDYITLCVEILTVLEHCGDEKSKELEKIIKSPFFRCLIEAHDNILYETYKSLPVLPVEDMFQKGENELPPIRVVGLTKNLKEPLGITLGKHADNCIYIQRILRGTMVEKQGLLNVGDVLQEINGMKVGTDVKAVQEKLQLCEGSISIKVIPAIKDARGICQVFLRCHFDYSPNKDSLFPPNEIGLSFQRGDILEIIDQSDLDWWQARHLDDSNKTGIIPSLKFEQFRQLSLHPKEVHDSKGGLFKKGKKIMYRTSENKLLDSLDVRFYEEVTKMPPVERKVVVLVGAQGVGRRTLKNKLIANFPEKYQDIIRDTSREPREGEVSGKGYNFREKDEMKAAILGGLYLEWGENNGNLYGTRLEEIRNVMKSKKICVIDIDPSALKLLKTSEFMPLIVFIEAPKLDILIKNNRKDGGVKQNSADQLKETVRESSDIEKRYHHYFDLKLRNEDLQETYDSLLEQIDRLSGEPQWVPISWVY